MSRNKHMKIVADAATLTGIAAGIGKTSKRVNDFWSESYFHELCEVHRSCLSFSCNKILSWRLRPVGLKKKRLDCSNNVRCLYAAGRVGWWSEKINCEWRSASSLLSGKWTWIVREELQIFPQWTELSPDVIRCAILIFRFSTSGREKSK